MANTLTATGALLMYRYEHRKYMYNSSAAYLNVLPEAVYKNMSS